jgi:predicted lysophospholipase L1 biosynthesis ABC-type transport system permease subunit
VRRFMPTRWTPEASAISVEEGLASSGPEGSSDSLRFDIAGQTNEARITSLRKVDWGSIHELPSCTRWLASPPTCR